MIRYEVYAVDAAGLVLEADIATGNTPAMARAAANALGRSMALAHNGATFTIRRMAADDDRRTAS